ncbi:MAG TPA: type II toxin-antitoxin system PemK/MazF family toxin [Allosphingosinicella sp.]|nr:type II toxin-antitoxin system PemK/MazF family toxin [Allosphingosinicella sp.]
MVRVPFPHVERNVRRVRPALVLTREPIGPEGLLVWAAMITNAERERWPGDVLIDDHRAAGLPVPSFVRTVKLATLEAASASRIGRLAPEPMREVSALVAEYLAAS